MANTSSTASMVSSNDVNGTSVYGGDGNQIGHIDHLMIDKKSGNVAYAVMGFGGILGIGEDPIPWNALRYDITRDGFVTDITESQSQGAILLDLTEPADKSVLFDAYQLQGVFIGSGKGRGAHSDLALKRWSPWLPNLARIHIYRSSARPKLQDCTLINAAGKYT